MTPEDGSTPCSWPTLMNSLHCRSAFGVRLLAAILLATGLGAAEDPAALLGQARKILTEDRNDASSRSAIAGLARTASPASRAAILAAVADARPPWAGSFAGEALDDSSPQVRAMAVSTLAKTWPTNLDDLDRVRRLLGDQDPVVVQAAQLSSAAACNGAGRFLLAKLHRRRIRIASIRRRRRRPICRSCARVLMRSSLI